MKSEQLKDPTVKECLAQLRTIFPKGHLRAEAHAAEADKTDDPEGESTSLAMITISRATERGPKSFRGPSLSDCMEQVRKWKESQ